MRAKLSLFIIIFTSLFCHSALDAESVFASFEINSEANYTLSDLGHVDVLYEIEIKNNETTTSASELNLTLNSITPEDLKVYNDKTDLKFEVKNQDKSKILLIKLDQGAVGLDTTQKFNISFRDKTLVSKSGEVWEVNIPRLDSPDLFNSFDVRIITPQSFGKLSFITPEPKSKLEKDSQTVFYFDKQKLVNGVHLAFGNSQVFSFDITYHLENPLIINSKTEIAIPTDTSYQTVYFDQIQPEPDSVYRDEDGNFMARYNLLPRERLDVRVLGYVEIFSTVVRKTPMTQDYLNKNLLESQYWQVNDPNIQKIANELPDIQSIYNYVVDSLVYDFDKVSPVAKRVGATQTLAFPKNAICMEFTDLFIALARAKGIPAREINGFAYTDNSELQPLSLVADVLHSWPEYWDKNKQVWVAVDPTWENTSGADYFTKFDLRHFAFVTHGVSSDIPTSPGSYKLGTNPAKDIFISIAGLPAYTKKDLELKLTSNKLNLKNTTNTTIYHLPVKIFFDYKLVYEKEIEYLLPYETKEIDIEMPYKLLGIGTPDKISVQVLEQTSELFVNKRNLIIRDLSLITFILVVVVLVSIIYFKKK